MALKASSIYNVDSVAKYIINPILEYIVSNELKDLKIAIYCPEYIFKSILHIPYFDVYFNLDKDFEIITTKLEDPFLIDRDDLKFRFISYAGDSIQACYSGEHTDSLYNIKMTKIETIKNTEGK